MREAYGLFMVMTVVVAGVSGAPSACASLNSCCIDSTVDQRTCLTKRQKGCGVFYYESKCRDANLCSTFSSSVFRCIGAIFAGANCEFPGRTPSGQAFVCKTAGGSGGAPAPKGRNTRRPTSRPTQPSDDSEYEYSYEEEEVPTPAPKPTNRPPTVPPRSPPTSPPANQPSRPPASSPPTNPNPPAPTGGYNIELIFDSAASESQRRAFQNAKTRWETVITSDIQSTMIMTPQMQCGDGNKGKVTSNKVVDDLLIFVDLSYIDGPNRILGQAGPCYVTHTATVAMARIGMMQFDIADVGVMEREGTFEGVILHEMAHVIGIGTLWEYNEKGLRYNLIPKVSRPLKFNGQFAAQGLAMIGGSGQPIVEEDGGEGTAEGHWDEEAYDNELLTGYVDSNMKLSQMTAQSLRDLGHQVSTSAGIDSYTISGRGRRRNLRGGHDDEDDEKKKNKKHRVRLVHDIRKFKPIVVDAIPYVDGKPATL